MTDRQTAERPDPRSPTPTVRVLEREDLPEVAALLEAAFEQPWPNFPIAVTPLEHLTWKTSSPTQIPEVQSVMVVDGRIASYMGSMSRDVWVRGVRMPGWSGADRAIHPDFQEQGLVRTHRAWVASLWEPGQEPMSLGEGSTHPRIIRSQERLGERVIVANTVDVLTRPLDAGPPRLGRGGLRSVLRGIRLRARMLGSRLRWRRFAQPLRPLAIRDVDSFDERADRLWERARDAFECAVVRDSEYLNWRYCDPRAGIYRVRIAEERGELVGFVVTTTIEGETRIVDLLSVPGDENSLRALIEDALATARAAGAGGLSILMPRIHPYRETFRRYGFIVGTQMASVGFNYRNLWALDFLAEDPAARFHIAFGDSDHM